MLFGLGFGLDLTVQILIIYPNNRGFEFVYNLLRNKTNLLRVGSYSKFLTFNCRDGWPKIHNNDNRRQSDDSNFPQAILFPSLGNQIVYSVQQKQPHCLINVTLMSPFQKCKCGPEFSYWNPLLHYSFLSAVWLHSKLRVFNTAKAMSLSSSGPYPSCSWSQFNQRSEQFISQIIIF